MELPTTDFDGQAALEDESISKAEEIRSEEKFDPAYEELCGEPYLYYLRSRYCPYSIPNYFKRDHPNDDLFMDNLGKLQVPHPQEDDEEEGIESVTKRAVVELIWKDTYRKEKSIWNNKEMEHLYTSIIESAAYLVYFLYPQAELYRIGRSRALHEELDELWDQLQEDDPYDEVCTLVNQLTSTMNKYQLVSEEYIDDMLYNYPNFRYPRFKNPCFPTFTVVAEEDKDKLYYDIAKVVNDLKPPPLEPDEYTHWMMTFLRGDAFDVEYFLLTKTVDDRIKCPTESPSHLAIRMLLNELAYKAKFRLKENLLNVVQPLIKICQPVRHEMSRVVIEIVEVAELRRIAAGNQFIGRSHLIWAFYKLGYSLPLEIRNRINLHDADEDHPPYHIYMAAVKLASLSGDEYAKLVHFIFVVIHSKDIGIDGQGVTEIYRCFEVFKQDLEEMENEIEPKHNVTMRPCRVVDAIIQEMRERYDN